MDLSWKTKESTQLTLIFNRRWKGDGLADGADEGGVG